MGIYDNCVATSMDIFSNLMVIGECLLDDRRTKTFQRAIQRTVTHGDTVVDIGTGSGILAMMAAQVGAKRIYAIDIAPDIVHFARVNVKNNNLSKKIKVIRADAKHFTLPRPADVMTMELMDTWLVGEQQAIALNQLRKNHVIETRTRLIPYRYQCAVTLMQYDFSFYGFFMPFIIQARNFGVRKHIVKKLSDAVIVQDINFQKPINSHINISISLDIQKNGNCNAVLLTAKTFLAPGISLWGTTDLNMPIIVPLKSRAVRCGAQVNLRIHYNMGMGFQSFSVMA